MRLHTCHGMALGRFKSFFFRTLTIQQYNIKRKGKNNVFKKNCNIIKNI